MCIIELVFNFSKITSFRQRQIAQHNAAVPTQIKPFIFLCWLFSHVPNIWPIDPGWFRLVAKKTILQIVLAKGQSSLNILIPIATNTLLQQNNMFSYNHFGVFILHSTL
jgi:hypothetical protein